MRTVVIFEDEGYRNLLPLTYWRTCWELRTGYGNLFESLSRNLAGANISFYCRAALADVTGQRFHVPVNTPPDADSVLFINGRLLLTAPLADFPAPAVQWHDGVPIVIHADRNLLDRLTPAVLMSRSATRHILQQVPIRPFIATSRLMNYPWDLVHANADMLVAGWEQAGKPAALDGRICEGVHLLNKSAIHVGAGSTIKPGVVLDAENGPIFIGQNVTIAPNTSIEGPCYIGDGSLIQPGSALRHGMSIGPRCKAGGELETSIIHGYSNKQHDGFLGHAYIGEWGNLAADTVNSDLKNTYGTIRVPVNGVEIESGQIFVGLTVGDHSKTGIGQMFPTGAVVGFGCNVATAGFAPRFVPSFTWLTSQGPAVYDVERCLDVAKRVMARRQVVMTSAEEKLFRTLPAYAAQIETPPKA